MGVVVVGDLVEDCRRCWDECRRDEERKDRLGSREEGREDAGVAVGGGVVVVLVVDISSTSSSAGA